jgi:hypothetical protein
MRGNNQNAGVSVSEKIGEQKSAAYLCKAIYSQGNRSIGIWEGVAMPDPSTPCQQATPETAFRLFHG